MVRYNIPFNTFFFKKKTGKKRKKLQKNNGFGGVAKARESREGFIPRQTHAIFVCYRPPVRVRYNAGRCFFISSATINEGTADPKILRK